MRCEKSRLIDKVFHDLTKRFERVHYHLYDTFDQRLHSGRQTVTDFFMPGRDGFKHHSSHSLSDVNLNAGNCDANENLILCLRRERAMFEAQRLSLGDYGDANGAKFVFAIRFQILWRVCSLFSTMPIADRLLVIRSSSTASMNNNFRVFNSGDGFSARNTSSFAVRIVLGCLEKLLVSRGLRDLPRKEGPSFVFAVWSRIILRRKTNERQNSS